MVVAPARDQDRVVHRQEAHRVAEARRRRLPLHLEGLELAMHHLSVDDHRLEVAQLVLEFALLVLSAEEVDAFKHRVALQQQNRFG